MSEGFLADRPMPYCRGCGHGVVAKKLNDALLRLDIDPSRVVVTSDIGCVGLVDPLFPSVHTVHTLHGRSTAMAAGTMLADGVLGDGRLKNVVMIGDGGATIGLLHLTQAALMNVDMTVLLHNNMLYGMTGGQHSALTPQGFSTTTTRAGNFIPALDMEQVLAGCQAGFYARKLATDADLADVVAEALAYPGFALVEILELCTGFGVPLNRLSGKVLRERTEAAGQKLGVRIRRGERRPYHEVYREQFPPRDAPDAGSDAAARSFPHRLEHPYAVVVAGSAGERVQSAAAVLAQAGLLSGLHCIQKNDYPVTVGSGFSLAEVKISPEPIGYTGIERPDAVLVASGDGLKKLLERGDLVRAGAMVIADDQLDGLPEAAVRLPLRRALSPKGAALGAIARLVRDTGILEPEALVAAAEVIGGEHAPAIRKTLAAATAL